MKFISSTAFKLLALVFMLALLWYESVIQHNKDFDVYVGASKLVAQGQNCYGFPLACDFTCLPYFYSPLFALLMYPFSPLSQIAYNLVWLLINYVVIYRSFVLLTFFLKIDRLTLKAKHWFYILVSISMARYIVDNLALGQMTLILVWGTLESMRLITERKLIFGTALLALMINIKIIPLAVLAYLVYKRDLRAVLLSIFFFVLYLFLPAIIIGLDSNTHLLSNWFSTLTNAHTSSIKEDIGRPSLSALIPALLMDMAPLFPIKRNFVNLNAAEVNLILDGVRLVFAGALAVVFGRPFQKVTSRTHLFYDLSLVCLASPLIFPHQGKYSVYYLLPAYAYCIYFLIKMRPAKSRLLIKKTYAGVLLFTILSFVLVTLTSDGIIGRHLSDFSEYLYLITFGMFFLMIAMVFVRPKHTATLTTDQPPIINALTT